MRLKGGKEREEQKALQEIQTNKFLQLVFTKQKYSFSLYYCIHPSFSPFLPQILLSIIFHLGPRNNINKKDKLLPSQSSQSEYGERTKQVNSS